MTHLQRLAKSYELEVNDYSFFDYIIETLVNGNFSSIPELVRELTRKEYGQLISYCHEYGGQSGQELIRYLNRL